jgi:uncharacterized protein
MRFICDEMLVGLARLLRAAGHDALLPEPGTPDQALLDRATAEGRLLVTQDRRLAAAGGELLCGRTPFDQAAELSRKRAVNWRLAPFTRCLIDNTPLAPATEEQMARMPASARAGEGPFRACPACERVFWPGSHTRRLMERLVALDGPQAAAGSRASGAGSDAGVSAPGQMDSS